MNQERVFIAHYDALSEKVKTNITQYADKISQPYFNQERSIVRLFSSLICNMRFAWCSLLYLHPDMIRPSSQILTNVPRQFHFKQ